MVSFPTACALVFAVVNEGIFLFSFLALIIPFIPVSDIMLKCVVATYIGEFMEMFWHKYGENYPWPMAFLKVFPRSLIYVYVFHKALGFLADGFVWGRSSMSAGRQLFVRRAWQVFGYINLYVFV